MSTSIKRQKRNLGSHIILIAWSFIVLFPIWTLVINSFKTRLTIYENPFWIPKVWNFTNYATVLRDGDFITYFKNTFIVVTLSLALVSFFASLAAYAFARNKGKIYTLLYYFFIAGLMLPIKIASIRILDIVRSLGLLNTIWALPPIYIAMGLPVGIFILTTFIRDLPSALSEAAHIDGASSWQIYALVILPLIRSAMATVTIYNLIPFWNDLWFPLITINDESQKTLLLGVTRLFGQYQTDWSKVLAVLTLAAIPVLGLYLGMSSQFIKGVTAGSVKG
ncbi:MAG: carbohydrate ABC transporter permease [Sphaerochaeta sp.]|jgi:raffinose/stachyose/melibiose transport system permease protein|nr:MAG: carbohydrate ABC transporter permease [Sphaerochaeta sp.]HNZ94273.1 carbohydrate ABC transporter permease [Sphaerochaeta sp.]HPB42446.1 carbohydrate ABC transporter permease [Sphaerochaeta sp.]HPY45474.1 carbohydrate ABC transporter permease [Sphaerochaeta sp.]HQB05352.1 carbohydrate ABC transporter permease [Sphaerochaeta sp.]